MSRTVTAVAVSLTVVSALALSACGSGGGGDQAKADAKQTLTVWGMGEEGKRLQGVADQFTKSHPNIKIKVTPVGWDVVHQKMVSAAAAGKLPDMAQMGSTDIGGFIALDSLEPVDTSTFHQGDFFPAAWNGNVKDGKTYGVPWYVDTRVLYYRTDLAKKAGVTRPPATWQDMRALAAAYKKKGGTEWGLSLQPGSTGAWQNWLPFLFSAGGEVLGKDGKPALDSPQAIKAFTEYASYFRKGLSDKRFTPGYDVVKDFGASRVPMFPSGPWIVQNITEQQPQLNGKWKVATLPADRSSSSFVGGSSLVTFKSSSHKAAAKEFIKFLTTPGEQATWFTASKDLPAVRAAWQEPALRTAPNTAVFQKQLDTAKEIPPMAKWNEFSAQIDDALAKICQKGADPATTAKQLQKSAEGLVS
jgi:multiple sugar transport system substrate-binding protein